MEREREVAESERSGDRGSRFLAAHDPLTCFRWERTSNMSVLRCSSDSEAYTSGLFGSAGHPAKVLQLLLL